MGLNIGIKELKASKLGTTNISSIWLGDDKLWPTAPPAYKFQATYSDSSKYNLACDSSTTLTRNEVRSSSTPYSSMTTAVIGDCVTTLYRSFIGCKALSSVTLPNTVTNISSDTFYNCSSLISVDIPSGVTSIGGAAFESCSGLTSIDIPNSVTTIGSQAFRHCSGLTSIEIPSSVTDIGTWGFESCSSLINITINATTPPTLGTNVFNNTNNCPIYVPCDSVDAYKSATNWSTYARRIQPISGTCLDCNWNQYYAYDAVPQSQNYAARIDMNVDVSNGYFIDFGDGGLGYLSIKRETTSNVWKVVTEQGETPIVFDANDKATIKFSDYGFETMVIDEMSLFDGLPFDIELCESSE